jgi:opacity protein-like surface antigen
MRDAAFEPAKPAGGLSFSPITLREHRARSPACQFFGFEPALSHVKFKNGGLSVRLFLAKVGAALGALLPVACAQAADLPAPIPAPPPLQYAPPSRQFECYAGVLGEAVVSHPDWNNIPAPGVTQENFASGARGGGVVGCDILFPTSRTYLGVDMTAVYGSVKGSLGTTVMHNVPFEWALRVRFGFMLDDQWSIYIAGGPEDSYRRTTDLAGVADNGFDWGGQAAVGIEYRFSPYWRIRGEYAFTWPGFDSVHVTGLTLTSWNPTENLVRLAVIRRF